MNNIRIEGGQANGGGEGSAYYYILQLDRLWNITPGMPRGAVGR
jgi:hypothetical protein